MKAISVATIFFSAVLLWQSAISNGQTQGTDFCQLGLRNTTAATSCQEIYQGNPFAASGNYWLSNGQTVTEQYCDMDRIQGGITGGWLRVAYFNMADAGTNCPPPLEETNPGIRMCVKTPPTGCTSVVYSTNGVPYNRICGRVKGYQYGSPDAFGYHTGPKNINSYYTDGVSITYGSPRRYVWTYAAGQRQDFDERGDACPCASDPGALPPSFVGNGYYCESASDGPWQPRWYLEDPLWDGQGCPDDNSCCANPSLPYFCRTLPAKTKENIEVRLCRNENRANEDIGVELLEILVN